MFLSVGISSFAQKKEIAQAQTYVKSGANLDKAEASMRTLLKDSVNRRNMKIWLTLTEAVKKQYEQGNEKLYLKQKYDTTALFVTGRRMFLTYEAMDSIDAMPDRKGRVELKYRKKNAEYLNIYRKNLYNGGLYFIGKQKFGEAFSMFDSYIDCLYQPLFSGMKYSESSPEVLSSAYWATYCGAMLHSDSLALKYSELALNYKPGKEKIMQLLANIWQNQSNDSLYCKTLRDGFTEFPQSEYFFTRLVDYYNSHSMADSAMAVADMALATDSANTLFMYAKANILLNIGKYLDSITLCDRIIDKDDSLSEAYYTAGVSYLNLAFIEEKNSGRAARAKSKSYYSKALPYMEKYREMEPEAKSKWATALYNIYLNLNMGKKFEEISSVLQGQK